MGKKPMKLLKWCTFFLMIVIGIFLYSDSIFGIPLMWKNLYAFLFGVNLTLFAIAAFIDYLNEDDFGG